jgi:hypothetical protein
MRDGRRSRSRGVGQGGEARVTNDDADDDDDDGGGGGGDDQAPEGSRRTTPSSSATAAAGRRRRPRLGDSEVRHRTPLSISIFILSLSRIACSHKFPLLVCSSSSVPSALVFCEILYFFLVGGRGPATCLLIFWRWMHRM